jgi:hypothetical protein
MTGTAFCYATLSLYANLTFTEATGIIAPWPVSVAILVIIALAHGLVIETDRNTSTTNRKAN